MTHGTCIGRRCSESSRVVVHCVCCGVEGIDGILCEVVWSSIGPGQDANLPGCVATRIPWNPSLWAPESLFCITVRACHRKHVSCQQRPSLQTLPRDAISTKMENSRAAQGFKQHKAWPPRCQIPIMTGWADEACLHATKLADREGGARAQIDRALYASCHCQEAPHTSPSAQLRAIPCLSCNSLAMHVSICKSVTAEDSVVVS